MKDKTILVTGGTGSFGKQFVKRVLFQHPAKVIVYSRNEHSQVVMKDELQNKAVRFFIGDVRDYDRLSWAMRGVDYVVHAAALKHVDVGEYNPQEFVNTNIIGTKNVIETAILNNAEKLLAVSTDKAVNPVNLYGNTKAVADKLVLNSVAYATTTGTKCSVIRFGNFWGSSGSVIPKWKEQAKSGYIDITDESMTRFFIDLNVAVDRAFYVLKNMLGGEVWCPKMESITLGRLAEKVAPGARKRYIGLRVGEKLHEELIAPSEVPYTCENGKFYVIYGDGDRVKPDFVCRSDKKGGL